VNMFLKLKQESSGYPSWVQSKEQKSIHWGLPARRGNCSRQGINSQKFGAKKFGKIEIELNVV
jgi:hypothetical protein